MGGPKGEFDADFVTPGSPRAKRKTRHAKKMERFGGDVGGPRFEHVALRAAVTLRARVFPTEERARVEAAVRALFPDVEFGGGGSDGELVGRAERLERIAEVIRSSRIRDTAREVLRDAVRPEGVIRVELNKQAAAAGHVNFALPGGEVLGTLAVELRADRPEALVEELTWIEGESDERLFGMKIRAAARRSPRGGPRRHGR